jgi:hypothetical protein
MKYISFKKGANILAYFLGQQNPLIQRIEQVAARNVTTPWN